MPVTATGGTITYDGLRKVHTFTSDGTFTVTEAGNIELLVVGGGGSGGKGRGSGGGAGGIYYSASYAVTAKSYSVVVGAGGTQAAGADTQGNNGQDSSFDSQIGEGGGGGGAYNTQDGKNGGCGGGGDFGASVGVGSQGYDGSLGVDGASGGGGGGMGEAGGTDGASYGGDGVDTYSDLLTVANAGQDISGTRWIAGGGGGGGSDGGYGTGGDGGGGDGGANGTNGTANTGGGGGGCAWDGTASIGGSGIVIISYYLPIESPSTIPAIDTDTLLVPTLEGVPVARHRVKVNLV